MTLEDIPKLADISPGDTIITSGYSNIFPPNIMIGIIDTNLVKPRDESGNISVELVNKLSSITYAYVIKDRKGSELQKLEEE